MMKNKKKHNVIAMIPARMGSERLKMKNLVMLEGEPLIGHTIRAAIKSGVFDQVVLNADHPVFADIARQYNVEYYHRPAELASSSARSDDVIFDFIDKHPSEYLAWVNPISPLQPSEEVAAIIHHFINKELDSLITVRQEQVHCNFRDKPLNYNPLEKFAKTQDLDPLERFVYSVMMWRTQTYQETYRQKGYALLFGKMGFYPVSWLSSIIIKYEADIQLCQYILKGKKNENNTPLEYYPMPRDID